MPGHDLDQRGHITCFKAGPYDPEKDFNGGGRHRLERRLPRGAGRQPVQDAGRPAGLRQGHPGKLNFGYFNASSQVPAEVLATKAGVAWQGVAYKAIGNAWTDLYAAPSSYMFVDLTAGRGQVVANKARPLAITLPERRPLYPS